LRITLDKEFEYFENEPSTVGLRNVVKRWLKTKRNKLKSRFLGGRSKCLVNIELVHWENL
jgi:hypothetical protein